MPPSPARRISSTLRRPAQREPAVLVTGGAQGIGRRICERFLVAGYLVACCDRDRDACEAFEQEIGSPAARAFVADVGRPASVRAMVRQVVAWAGGLNALIANAGTEGGRWPIERYPVEVWNQVIASNLTGMFLCAQATAGHLRRRTGSIVTIASTRAVQSEPETFAYSASKGGVVSLTHALAISLGPHIRANCISPGWIAVEDLKKPTQRSKPRLRAIDEHQHPVGRVGTADDIAELAFYLCSPAAGFMTGAHVVCDGGMTRKMIYAP